MNKQSQPTYIPKTTLLMNTKALLVFSLLITIFQINAKAAKTYALIVGIAKYKDEKIKDLKYSDDDALAFYQYLTSPAGGNVDSNNIKLLLNENATVGNVYAAKTWLETKVHKDDKVYIYFSGHGDAESSRYKLGFILAHDSPHKNYLNNAVRIQDFNILANTLSLDKKAEVIIITDACRSGSLSGIDDMGKMALVQEELMKAQQKEIRMSSCRPDELSQENKVWGGGRGLFSYYLINGLNGLADQNNDNQVTVNELTTYLVNNVEDEINKYLLDSQTPVISGIKTKPIGKTSPEMKLVARNESQNGALENAQSKSIGHVNLSVNQKFMNMLSQYKIENKFDFQKWEDKSGDDFVTAVFEKHGVKVEKKERYDNLLQEWVEYLDTAYNFMPLKTLLDRNHSEQKLFKIELAATIHNEIQDVINLYLEGDEAELEKRRYYNEYKNGYGEIMSMIKVGMNLLPKADPLYEIFEVKKYYFKGIEARLQVLTQENKDSLLNIAEKAQLKALSLEPKASYINNELGVIYMFKEDYAQAKKYLKEATELSQEWAIPWANLCILYNLDGDNGSALSAGLKADSLQSDLQMAKTGIGRLYHLDKNYLLAEEYYREAINLNDQHFLPYEWLGHLYLERTDYALADSFLYEAELRKMGLNMPELMYHMSMVAAPSHIEPLPHCAIDTSLFLKDDYVAYYYWGQTEYNNKNYKNAIRIWKKVVAIDPANPIVFHYLGIAYLHLKEREQAELMFRLAKDLHVESEEISEFHSNQPTIDYPYDRACYLSHYLSHAYPSEHNYFFLGMIYEDLGLYTLAENEYDEVISIFDYYNAEFAYLKKWSIMEKFDRWLETEKSVLSCQGMEQGCGNCNFPDDELNAFYKRAIAANPDDGSWPYKLALFLYNKRHDKSLAPSIDTVIYSHPNGKEVFIDKSNYSVTNFINIVDITQSPPPLIESNSNDFANQYFKDVPGTHEEVAFAGRIWCPRKEAISNFKLALGYYFDPDITSDINFKIGETYIAAGSHQMAYPFFEKSTEIQPTNMGFHKVALQTSKKLYKNRSTLNHLNHLEQHNALDYESSLLLSECSIYNKEYQKVDSILSKVQQYYPYRPYDIQSLYGRFYHISDQHLKAIDTYESLLFDGPMNPNYTYTLAKSYASHGNKEKAIEILKAATEAGFNYTYVLEADPIWKKVVEKNIWEIDMIIQFPLPQYRISLVDMVTR